jgi:hypothetical protein
MAVMCVKKLEYRIWSQRCSLADLHFVIFWLPLKRALPERNSACGFIARSKPNFNEEPSDDEKNPVSNTPVNMPAVIAVELCLDYQRLPVQKTLSSRGL